MLSQSRWRIRSEGVLDTSKVFSLRLIWLQFFLGSAGLNIIYFATILSGVLGMTQKSPGYNVDCRRWGRLLISFWKWRLAMRRILIFYLIIEWDIAAWLIFQVKWVLHIFGWGDMLRSMKQLLRMNGAFEVIEVDNIMLCMIAFWQLRCRVMIKEMT